MSKQAKPTEGTGTVAPILLGGEATTEARDLAIVEIDTVRGVVDLVYEVTTHTFGQLEQRTLGSAMHDALERLDRARELLLNLTSGESS